MTLNVGYAVSSLLLVSVFLASLVAQLASKRFHAALFWTVILTTSTAGATFGDLLSKPPGKGGLGFGTVGSSIVLAALVVAFLAWDGARWR